MPNDNVLTDDLRQRCREMLELIERGESARPTLRALADTYHPDIPPHVRLSMAESQTHREAMRALLATPQPEPSAEVTLPELPTCFAWSDEHARRLWDEDAMHAYACAAIAARSGESHD